MDARLNLASSLPGSHVEGARRSSNSARCLGILAIILLTAAAPPASASATGVAVSWGENFHGQLGAVFRSTREEVPVAVQGLDNITAIASATNFSLALLSNGTVDSWGGNLYGQLGNDGRRASWEQGVSHVAVQGLTGVTAISAADAHALALSSNGTVETWGNDQYGQLGTGASGVEKETGKNQRVPQAVPGLTNVVAIASGGASDYALLANHTILAWGSNSKGQLGNGTSGPESCDIATGPATQAFACSRIPRPVVTAGGTPLEGVLAVYAGATSAYALLANGHVMSWGGNSVGQLGRPGVATGTRTKDIPPGEVITSADEPLSGVTSLAAAATHVLARLGSGQVLGWGNNAYGGLGRDGGERCGKTPCDPAATPIAALDAVKAEAIAAGGQYSLVLSGGRVLAFGQNQWGQLGNGGGCENPGGRLGYAGTCYSRVPTAISGLEHVAAIAASNTHAIALLNSESSPLPPAVDVTPAAGAFDLTWTVADVVRISWRPFARTEPAEQETKVGEREREEAEETQEAEEGSEARSAVDGAASGKWQRVPLSGSEWSVVENEFAGAPLESAPYEVKVESGKAGVDRKSRTLIALPAS